MAAKVDIQMTNSKLYFAVAKLFVRMLSLGLVLSGASCVILGIAGTQEKMRIFFSLTWLAMVLIVFVVSCIAMLVSGIGPRKMGQAT